MIHKVLLHNCYNTVCAIRLSSFSNFVNIDFISSLFPYPSRLASHKYKDIFFTASLVFLEKSILSIANTEQKE